MSDLVQRARTELPTATHVDLGRSTWNLGCLNGGTTPNVVPAQARAVIDHRTVGDQNDLLHWWQSEPETHQVNALLVLPAVWTSAATPWLSTIPATVSNSPVPYFTDASHIAQALPGVPVTIWGPGDPAAMHVANERISLLDIELAIDLYTRVIHSWDGTAGR
jgi:succinyl-diaminopimelate desuccinylase